MYRKIAVLQRLFLWILFAAFAPLVSSCIKDDRDDCDDAETFLLYVKVVDTETGADLTATGDVEQVILALFDRDGRFITTRLMDRGQIIGREPLALGDLDVDGLQISAWGDVGENVVVSNPGGQSVEGEFVRLETDGEGYSASPSDFFFGFKTIGPAARATRTEEVVITQKNSRLNITARGLPLTDDDDYYFVIEAPQSGYGFSGKPNADPCRVRRTGKFSGRDFVSPEPCLMIHSAEDFPGHGVTVRLIQKTSAGHVQMAVAEKDDKGNPIRLLSGKTTNVLMDLTASGGLEILVEVTPWREVYQWPLW